MEIIKASDEIVYCGTKHGRITIGMLLLTACVTVMLLLLLKTNRIPENPAQPGSSAEKSQAPETTESTAGQPIQPVPLLRELPEFFPSDKTSYKDVGSQQFIDTIDSENLTGESKFQNDTLLKRNPKLAGRLEAQLIKALEETAEQGEAAIRANLKDSGVIFADNGQDLAVVVFIEENKEAALVRKALESQGATVIRDGDHTIKVAIPILKLAALTSVDGVAYVRTVKPPRENVVTVSQGVSTTLANGWHSGGMKGMNAKVAVVDSGFSGYSTLQSNGELPASAILVNYSTTSMSTGSAHGSACAEVIYDMAPEATLVLIKIDDPTDLELVKNYCIANGVHVVSCSLGYDGMNFHDGIAHKNWFSTVATHPVTAVDQATAGGVMWVHAAGNEQRKHTLIDWLDADSDNYLDWNSSQGNLNLLYLNGSTNIPAGTQLDIILTWNQWPITNQDFDLHLFKNSGSGWTAVTTGFSPGWSGNDTQNGSTTSYPHEEIIYTTSGSTAQYAVGVRRYGTTTSPKFILRYYGISEPHYFGYGNIATPVPGSLAIPSDAASAFTVGALDFATYTTGGIEFYSSLGPNNRSFTGGTAVTKPDICGPVRIDTVTYGLQGFSGTSAATPHVAGLAALAKAAYPALTQSGIKAYVESKALDRGVSGKDNTFGSGAGRVTSAAPPTLVAINRAGTTPTNAGSVQFQVTFSKSVTGGSTSNYVLATTGVTGASITSVTGSGSTRTVTVNTGTGSGNLGLNMANSTGVADSAGNAVSGQPFSGMPFTGQVYTIDKSAPTVIASPSGTVVTSSPISFTLTFSEPVTGLTSSGITVTNGTKGSLSGSGTTYTLPVTPTEHGAVTCRVNGGAALDTAGNGNTASNLASVTFTSKYAIWAQSQGLTVGVNDGVNEDPDKDRIVNLLEFVLGGSALTPSSSVLPVPTLTTTDLVLTFKRSDDAEDNTTQKVQIGTNLGGWADFAVIGAVSGGQMTIVENGTAPDDITVRIPRSNEANGKLFARLVVTQL